jgi:hypothetical protein
MLKTYYSAAKSKIPSNEAKASQAGPAAFHRSVKVTSSALVCPGNSSLTKGRDLVGTPDLAPFKGDMFMVAVNLFEMWPLTVCTPVLSDTGSTETFGDNAPSISPGELIAVTNSDLRYGVIWLVFPQPVLLSVAISSQQYISVAESSTAAKDHVYLLPAQGHFELHTSFAPRVEVSCHSRPKVAGYTIQKAIRVRLPL